MNYASSKWCLDELVEIMKCREESNQTVIAIFYKVEPSDVNKVTGDFGNVFEKACAGEAIKDIERWRQALAKVATVGGYHSNNWDNEATMIKTITTDITDLLNNSIPSIGFDGLVEMRTHLKAMGPLLCLDSEEVRMIGIQGFPGIGKTTIARAIYNQYSNNFQLTVFMENMRASYVENYFDQYSSKLELQEQFLSKLTNRRDIRVPHLGYIRDKLKDKKVLVVLDGVDKLLQLQTLAKEKNWFGRGSRIIITTTDFRLLRAFGIVHIYCMKSLPTEEALQIFCTYAFGQKFPKDGFEELAREVTEVVDKLPLALRVMGSYFQGSSKQEGTVSLPRLYTSLDDADIQSSLKFIYDALYEEDKNLFRHIACCFNPQGIKRVEGLLEKSIPNPRRGLTNLSDKSLISIHSEYPGYITMHSLLEKLGKDIVRRQSIREPLRRHFLFDEREIFEVLTSDAAESKHVMGINFDYFEIREKIDISERAFERMYSLRFLRFDGFPNTLHLPRGLTRLPPLHLLHWSSFPLKCLPTVNVDSIVELVMKDSKLERLWEGIRRLESLKWMDLSFSINLEELPDLSTARNLQELNLCGCSNLVELPSSIGNAVNLQELNLCDCSSLVELPSSIGNAINLQELNLRGCSSLVALPSSIGNAINLQELNLRGCSSLVALPSSIGNANALENLDLSNCSNLVELPFSIGNFHKLERMILEGCSKLEILPTNIDLGSLDELDLTNCSLLRTFPEISTNVRVVKLKGTAIKEVPCSIMSWPHLSELHMSHCENLEHFPHAFDSITNMYFQNPEIILNFGKCFKLNQEARDLIIQTTQSGHAVLPGVQVPTSFTHRATSGGPLSVELIETPLPTSMRFKACIVLLYIGDDDAGDYEKHQHDSVIVTGRQSRHLLNSVFTEHLYIFEVKAEVTSSELVFDFKVNNGYNWKIGECGVSQPSC